MRVLCPFEVQIFTSTHLMLHLLKLQMVVIFSSSIFWTQFFFKLANFFEIYAVDSILFFRFECHFFLLILPCIWSKMDKSKIISPMDVCGVFSCRYRKNNQVEKKLPRSDIGCVIYVHLMFKFSQTPLTLHLLKLQMTVIFSSCIFCRQFFI